jgi:hypothetical protein
MVAALKLIFNDHLSHYGIVFPPSTHKSRSIISLPSYCRGKDDSGIGPGSSINHFNGLYQSAGCFLFIKLFAGNY